MDYKLCKKAEELNSMDIGHAMWKENTERIKAIINWNPNGKIPRGKPKKRWNWEEYT